MNGAESLVHTLADGGVDVCFANPGTSEMHFVSALDKTRRMRCVLCLFEGVVSGAADGYGRMLDRPSANLLHLGPGLANACANLHNAKKALTPILNIIGDHAIRHLELDAPLEADVEGTARPYSHWVHTSISSKTVAGDGAAALAASLSYPGKIASLILPADTAWNEANGPAPVIEPEQPALVADEVIEQAARILEARKPTALYMGYSALANKRTLKLAGAIASRYGASLMCPTSMRRMERGAGLPFVGRQPFIVPDALEAFKGFQHAILVEAKEPVAFFAYPNLPGKILPPSCAVFELARRFQSGSDAIERLAQRLNVKEKDANLVELSPPSPPVNSPINGETFAQTIAASLPEDAIVIDESITSGAYLYGATRNSAPHTWLSNTGGSIGIGIPLAVGAAVACPDRPVLCLQADGSGMYTLQGLWTQAREGLKVINIILNNKAYAILHREVLKVGANPGPTALSMFDLNNPELDWSALAQGMGVQAYDVSDTDALYAAIRRSLAAEGPSLINAVFE